MLDELAALLWASFTALGDAFTMILILVFDAFKITLPDWVARVTLLAASGISLWWFNTRFPKILLVATVIIAASIFFGFL